jgi:DNA-binding CsgD family transcriptional regulator
MSEQHSQNEPGQERGQDREDDQGDEEPFGAEIEAGEDKCGQDQRNRVGAQSEQPGDEEFRHPRNLLGYTRALRKTRGYPGVCASCNWGRSYPLPMTVLLMPQEVSAPTEGLCPACQRTAEPTSNFPVVYLTRQERQALALYASGLTMYSVARRMEIQPSSAATYIKRIRKKYAAAGLPLPSKVDLHRAAKELGLIA